VVHVDDVFNGLTTHWTVMVTGITDWQHAKNVVGIWDLQEVPKFLFVRKRKVENGARKTQAPGRKQ
ncbi:uncharacterized protein METZ01_LOCUS46937, partial [marine metagenome]